MDPALLLQAGGVLGLFVATGTVLTQLLRQNGRLNREREQEIKALKREARRANARIDVLVYALQRNKIEVPPEVWNVVADD